MDLGGAAQEEYRTYLQPSGQPGVGDRFYQVMLASHPDRVERIELPTREDGQYEDVPQAVIDAGFDPSDRKWIALALRGAAKVATSVDTDWINHRHVLQASGVPIRFVCGVDRTPWFAD
jgi:hypothetical protein